MRILHSGYTSKYLLNDVMKENIFYRKGLMIQHSNAGFSLVEVLIALVVLLVGMLGVMGMQYYAITGNTTSRETRIATSLNQEIIEQIKSTPYAQLSSLTSPETPFSGSTDKSITGGLTNITRLSWILNDCVSLHLVSDDGTCNPSLVSECCIDPDTTKAVDVSAIRTRTCWNDSNGDNHSITFDSIRWDENEAP